MPGFEVFRSLLQQSQANGSRSTALNPIAGALALLLSALLAAIWLHAVMWVDVLLAVFASLVLAVFLFTYVYFVFKNSDALRSEKFTLYKIALERSLTGDTLKGFSEVGIEAETAPARVGPSAGPEPE